MKTRKGERIIEKKRTLLFDALGRKALIINRLLGVNFLGPAIYNSWRPHPNSVRMDRGTSCCECGPVQPNLLFHFLSERFVFLCVSTADCFAVRLILNQ
jgi:hypothetical protein